MVYGSGGLINPQSWSLALEVQAYLVLPFILRNKVVKYFVAIISFAFFMIASMRVGGIDADTYGWRLLPGTIFMFIIGSFINDSTKKVIKYLV